MRDDVKEAWIAWLNDPTHEQGRGHLHRNQQYCCLGGLCEVAMQMGVPIQWRHMDDEFGVRQVAGQNAYLPPVVVEWAGLSAQDPSVGAGGILTRLSVLNDMGDLTFPEIAILIKEQL